MLNTDLSAARRLGRLHRAEQRGVARLIGRGGQYRFIAFASGLVCTMVAALALGHFAGRWLDRHLGTRPWLTLAGTLLGLGAALAALLRTLTVGGGRA